MKLSDWEPPFNDIPITGEGRYEYLSRALHLIQENQDKILLRLEELDARLTMVYETQNQDRKRECHH